MQENGGMVMLKILSSKGMQWVYLLTCLMLTPSMENLAHSFHAQKNVKTCFINACIAICPFVYELRSISCLIFRYVCHGSRAR